MEIEASLCDGVPQCDELFDLIIANPPFISGTSGRRYRDGGEQRGLELPLRWAADGAARLASNGCMMIYTGSPIVGGRDLFREGVQRACERADCTLAYDEVDPDIFGGLLTQSDYADVERIAAVWAVLTKR